MDQVRQPSPHIQEFANYSVSEPLAKIILSGNENPENVPGEVVAQLTEELSTFPFNRYPDPLANKLRDQIAEANGLERDNVVIGNGGDELLFNLFLAWGGKGRTFLDMPPTFSVYKINAHLTNTNVVSIPRTRDFDVDSRAVLDRVSQGDIDFLIVANPNNPTGNLTSESFLVRLLESTDALVMVDEAYFEFSRQTMRPYMMKHKNLVILRTFSKAFSLAGLRVGYILAHEDVAAQFALVRQPYSVDSLSQWIASTVYRDRAAFEQGISEIVTHREWLFEGLCQIPEIKAYPSEANYILFRVDDARDFYARLRDDYHILIRDVSSDPLLAGCLRVTVGSQEENEQFLLAAKRILEERAEEEEHEDAHE